MTAHPPIPLRVAETSTNGVSTGNARYMKNHGTRQKTGELQLVRPQRGHAGQRNIEAFIVTTALNSYRCPSWTICRSMQFATLQRRAEVQRGIARAAAMSCGGSLSLMDQLASVAEPSVAPGSRMSGRRVTAYQHYIMPQFQSAPAHE